MTIGEASAPTGDPTWRDDIEHCDHHQHDDRCGGAYGECDWDYGADHCVHCECCCTCLGCEYGPRDGMLMFPAGVTLDGEAAPGEAPDA